MRLRNALTAGLVLTLVFSNAMVASANHRHNDRNNGEWKLGCPYGYKINSYGLCERPMADFCGDGIDELYDLSTLNKDLRYKVREFASDLGRGCFVVFGLSDFNPTYITVNRYGEIRLATQEEIKAFNKPGSQSSFYKSGIMYKKLR